MPHQCVRCNTFYEDGSDAILKGCTCGAKLFFYVKKEKLEAIRAKQKAADDAASVINLAPEAKQELEQDVYEIIGTTPDEPVVLDLEAIHVLQPGKYQLDLVHLFKGDPVVFKLADGKYVIDVAETFERMRKK